MLQGCSCKLPLHPRQSLVLLLVSTPPIHFERGGKLSACTYKISITPVAAYPPPERMKFAVDDCWYCALIVLQLPSGIGFNGITIFFICYPNDSWQPKVGSSYSRTYSVPPPYWLNTPMLLETAPYLYWFNFHILSMYCR